MCVRVFQYEIVRVHLLESHFSESILLRLGIQHFVQLLNGSKLQGASKSNDDGGGKMSDQIRGEVVVVVRRALTGAG